MVITGFSTPEGSLDEKEALALVDRTTLRILVPESNMPEKYKVLAIIDNVPARGNARNKGRLAQLTALNDGEDYRDTREMFSPRLRQTGAYVKIYYENVR